MKKVGLALGLLLMVLSGIVFVVCLALPSMTDNRVSFEEALLGIIPALAVFLLALVVTVVCLILLMTGRKSAGQMPQGGAPGRK